MAIEHFESPAGQALIERSSPKGCVGIIQDILYHEGDFDKAEAILSDIDSLYERASACGEIAVCEVRRHLANRDMPIEARLYRAQHVVDRAEDK